MRVRARVAALALLAVLTITGCMPFPDDPEPTNTGASFSSCGAATGDASGIPGVTPEMAAVAKAIADTAIGLGLGKHGATIGVVVSYTESTLRTINFGDYSSNGQMTTSRGPFQQKAEWGPLADRLDPVKSATMFFTGGQAGQSGLTDIAGWQTMPVPQAAQAVQRSGYADGSNFARNLDIGTQITNAIVTSESCAPIAPGGPVQINKSQDPSTFGWQHNGPMEPLVFQGHNFGSVAAGTGPLWQGLLTDIVPHIPGGLNNYQGCYADRQNVNSPGRLSFHAYGLACDVNFNANPNGSDPAFLTGPHVIPISVAQQAAAKWGMEWGGDWGYPDPMHFEIHISPDQVRQITGVSTV